MTFEILPRIGARFAVALVLGLCVAAAPGMTPSASAVPPADCAQVEQLLAEAEAKLRGLRSDLAHLLNGGVTQDEVAFVSSTLDALAAAQDDAMFLRAIMYKCLRLRGGATQDRKLRQISILQAQITALRSKALVLVAQAHAARR